MPTADYQRLMATIHQGSPYDGFDAASRALDVQEWANSNSPVFDLLIKKFRPSLIIEIGTWKGASAIHMAELLKAHGISATIVCIDTWLGTDSLWKQPDKRKSLALKNGYPTVYYTFLANVMKTGHSDVIVPVPLPSAIACRWLKTMNVEAGLVYIDADHEAPSVYADMSNCWDMVSPHGAMFGDDFLPGWPGVQQAVSAFSRKVGIQPEIHGEKWVINKSSAPL